MLKKTITFEDFNGQTITEDFYFNLTKAELVELEVSEKEGFAEALSKIVQSEDGKMIVSHFKKIILLAYGKKSADGRQFIKNEQLREEFVQTEAYSQLFMELATDAEKAAAFVNGVVPSSMVNDIQAATENVELPTAPPVLATETQPPTVAATEVLTDEELLRKDPKMMTQAELHRAYLLKSQQ